ncbi:MAG: plasmid stabilization system protein ParE [Candidatus Binatia bacterium]
MNYRFTTAANQELVEAAVYYDSASPGLGGRFLDELEATIRRIQLNSKTWRTISDSHRKCRIRKFPFALIYALEDDVILIVAVMDLRRKPNYWKDRL